MKQKRTIIAPSILSADFSRLGDEIRDVAAAGCDWIHVDVMDGHFVPNLTIGPPVVQSIRKVTDLPLDVHLMIEEPIRYLSEFRKAGSDWITIHVEACKDIAGTLEEIRRLGAKAGITLKPKTSVEKLDPFLPMVDLILVMTVEPGFGGQAFMPDMIEKVKYLRPKFSGLISVDGGIDSETCAQAAAAGVDVYVAGSAVFREKDRKQSIQKIRTAAAAA